jgi:hypothetical protein
VRINPHTLGFSGERQRQTKLTIGFVAVSLILAYYVAGVVVSGSSSDLLLIGIAAIIGALTIAILKNWRRGLLAFLAWLLFEDLARKYLGNNMAIFFLKDGLILMVYLSFFLAYRRHEERFFRLPFRLPLLLLIWLGVLQIFNPESPSLGFGLLGMKIYFCYIPLLFVGYALLDSEVRLRQFFTFNLALIFVIASLGIAQSILGHTFLNPETLSDDIRELGALYRVSPSGAISYRPTSVFVSAGRFADFLDVAWLCTLGFSGYLILRHRRGRAFTFIVLGVTAAAAVMCASRGVFMYAMINGAMTAFAFVWGAPWRQREAMRAIRTVQRAALGAAIALGLLSVVFPEALGSRLSLYTETLSPNSATSELGFRAWDYPVQNLFKAFANDHWPYGYGIGTSSLGTQYVVRFFHTRPIDMSVESGFGTLVVELGIAGLCLWIVLGTSVLVSAFRVVHKLKGSPFFPLAFVIFWYCFIVFFPATFAGIQPYQDFVLNAYLWLLLGILFRLPSIPLSPQDGSGRLSNPTPELMNPVPL